MSLIMNDKGTLKISISFKEDNNNQSIVFYEDDVEKPSDIKVEEFTFRRPNWADTRNMMSASATVTSDGSWKLDPWKYTDIRIKTLLIDWTLKGKDGENNLKLTTKNIDNLNPSLVNYLSEKLEKHLS